MTLGDAKAQLRLRGVTINKTQAGDYRVNFLHGSEATARYEETIVNAYGTGLAMAAQKTEGQRLCRYFENETRAARFYGVDYVIAGRAVDIINSRIVDAQGIAELHEDALHERRMKLWSIRSYIVRTYRIIR